MLMIRKIQDAINKPIEKATSMFSKADRKVKGINRKLKFATDLLSGKSEVVDTALDKLKDVVVSKLTGESVSEIETEKLNKQIDRTYSELTKKGLNGKLLKSIIERKIKEEDCKKEPKLLTYYKIQEDLHKSIKEFDKPVAMSTFLKLAKNDKELADKLVELYLMKQKKSFSIFEPDKMKNPTDKKYAELLGSIRKDLLGDTIFNKLKEDTLKKQTYTNKDFSELYDRLKSINFCE